MAIQVQGFSGTVADVDGTTFRALRVTVRPVDYGSLGIYRVAPLSGTMAAGLAANAEIFQARWTDATRFALIHGFLINGMSGSATAFTAGFASMSLTIARSWSADGSGGTTVTLTGNNQKLRTSMGSSLFGSMRGASTAALTAGTKTLDAQPVGLATFAIGTASSAIYLPYTPLFGEVAETQAPMPIILAANEGVVARATVPATGTWQFGVTQLWSEVSQY